MMNLASIDIGSNGARLLIKRFDPEAIREEDRIKKLMFIRIPLRLGKDVFTLGKVSKEREKMMLHMMKGFKQFMKLNDVEAFRACATSAMRDAENGKKVLKKIEKQTGIKLEIIKGQEEAQLLYNNLVEKTDSNEGSWGASSTGPGSAGPNMGWTRCVLARTGVEAIAAVWCGWGAGVAVCPSRGVPGADFCALAAGCAAC